MFSTKVRAVEPPFEGQLASLVKNPPENSIRMEITPSRAADMLKYNIGNRPCTATKVKLYARQMESGDWRYTRVPIIFSDAGRLIDGQHRLNACLESETPITADVAFGAADESFAFIDVGKGRSAADIFAINQVQNAATMASATGWVCRYEQGKIYQSNKGAITAAELYDEYLKHPDLQRSFNPGAEFGRSRLAPPSMMVALHYICAQKCRRDADAFFGIACEGMGAQSKSDPAFELHKRLIKNAISQEKLPSNVLAGLTLTAWNRYRDGRSGRGLRYSSDMKFPRAR